MKKINNYINRLLTFVLFLLTGILLVLPASLQAQAVLDNGKLRFGTGFAASVDANGNILQPFYKNAGQQEWGQLTFSAYSLENAIGVGGSKTDEWNTKGTIIQNPALSNQVLDVSGFVATNSSNGTRGYGTIVSTGTILIGKELLEVKNTYVLPEKDAYIKITTRLKNISSGVQENVRVWVGTRDDWVGKTDMPVKHKGNLVNGIFVPVTRADEKALALQITSDDEGVFFYTNSPKASTIIQDCCSFNNVIEQNPLTSTTDPTSDASYGFYVRLNDLAVGASDEFTWYYAAGELALLPDIIVDVAAAIGGISNIQYTSATLKATVTGNGTGYWMVVPRNSAQPTAAQIKAGTPYSPAVVASGNGNVTANVGQLFNISGLTPGTKYDLYFVSENADAAFSAVLQVPFNTQAYSAPVVSTKPLAAITKTGALAGGQVTADGGTAIIARGVCWSVGSSPSIAGNKTTDGTGSGAFTSTLASLTPNTTYYMRAYATNAMGTAYGNQVIFKTSPSDPVSLTATANNLCVGTSTRLAVTGAQGTVHWYAGGCGGTAIGTGSTITVSPQVTTTYYARNYNGSFSGCASLTVVVNNAAPVAIGKDITVSLQADLTASVSAADIDNGSYDACGSVTLALTAGKTTYDCSDIGNTYPVVLTATDQQGNKTSVTVQVQVTDAQSYCNKAPVAIAKPLILSAGNDCQQTAAAAALDGGSTDADGDVMTFTVYPAGPYALGTTPVTLTVTDPDGASSTSATTITVTDDAAPVFAAINPISVNTDAGVCGAAVQYSAPVATDNCTVTTVQTAGLPSGALFPVGTTTNTFTATDASGNVATTSFTVTVTDKEAPVVMAKDLTIQLDATGRASLTAAQVDNGSSDNCGIASVEISKTVFSCTDLGANQVVLTVTDANGNSSSGNATITVVDNITPEFAPAASIAVNTDPGQRTAVVHFSTPVATDNCTVTTVQTAGLKSGSMFAVGKTTLVFTAADAAGNVTVANLDVTVTDKEAPVVKARNITVQLDAAGKVVITAAQVDNGSTDNVGIEALNLDKTVFNCSSIGTNEVVLKVTDVNGNESMAITKVTVVDNTKPTIITQNISVKLDAAGTATITPAQVDKGSADACGIASVVLDKTTFDCSQVGANTVTLTVTDVHGNAATATAVVTVQDVTRPVAKAIPGYAVTLKNGMASVTAAQLNNGSTDECGVASLTVSPATFTCADIGTRQVTLTVTDRSGNVATAITAVTVVGVVPVSAIRVVKCEHKHCTDSRCNHSRCADTHCRDKHEDHKHTGHVRHDGYDKHDDDRHDYNDGNKHDDNDKCDKNNKRGRFDHQGDRDEEEHEDDDDCEENKDHCGHKDHKNQLVHNGSCGYKDHNDNAHKNSCDKETDDHCGHKNHKNQKNHYGSCGNRNHGDNYHKKSCQDNTDVSPTILDKKTIYLGYGKQSVTLNAIGLDDAGSTYAWTGNGTLSSQTSGKPVFAPKAAGVYTFTVVETNGYGCTASSSVTITVIDVRCDNKNDNKSYNKYDFSNYDKNMVYICHKGQVICIAAEAVAAHLAHGDKIGRCASPGSSNARVVHVVEYAQEMGLTIYPNPAAGKTNVEFNMLQAGSYRLAIYDLKGAWVKDIAAGQAESNQFLSFQLDAKAYPVGVYLVRLTTDQEVVTKRLIIER